MIQRVLNHDEFIESFCFKEILRKVQVFEGNVS